MAQQTQVAVLVVLRLQPTQAVQVLSLLDTWHKGEINGWYND
jgi:hypothetical protein